MKRTLYLALTELYKKGSKIDNLVLRVYNSKELEIYNKDSIRQKFYRNFKIEAKW